MGKTTISGKNGISSSRYMVISGFPGQTAILDFRSTPYGTRGLQISSNCTYLHIKDLTNVVDAAKAVDAPIPLTQSVLEMMKVLHHDGDGACDHSALLKYYQKLTGEVLHH